MEEEFDLLGLANSLMVAIENERVFGSDGLIRIFLEAYYESKLEELVNLSVRGYNKTPLMYAINQKVDIEIIHQLINAGADVNDGDGTTTIITPLGELLSNVIPTSSTGKPRDIQYTAEVLVLLLDSGVDVTQQSDDKTPLELASAFLTDGDVVRVGKFSKQGIIDMIEQRIELEPSLMDLTNAMDNVDDEPLETVVENMKEELSKPRPESTDGKKYLQLLDTCQTFTGLTPLFFMLKFSVPVGDLLTYYNLFVQYYHPETIDSGKENILDQTYKSFTPIMMFLMRFNSNSVNPGHNPVELFRKMCENLKVGRNAFTGELRIGHPSRDDEINKRDMYGLTALDYANGGGVEEYINIIKETHPNAKTGTELGNISDPNSPFNGRPTKTGMLITIFGEEEVEPSTPSPASSLNDFPIQSPSTPSTPDGSIPPSPFLNTPPTFTPPGSPPPIRGRGDDDAPPRMDNLTEYSAVGREILPPVTIELPEDPKELEKLYFEEANKLIAPSVTNEQVDNSLQILKQILEKDQGLVNKYIGNTGLTLIMFATRIPYKVDYKQKVSLIELCLKNDADLVIKSSEGLTVLELAIDEENWIVVEILLNHSPLQDLIPEDKDALKIYNLLNAEYERYTEVLREEGSENYKAKKNITGVKILLKAVFGDLFNIVITSLSVDNYKWLPENLNPNVVNMNVGMEDLPDENNYIRTVCMGGSSGVGVGAWAEEVRDIKNNAKILEYLLKKGAHAYNANPYHEPLEDSPLALVLFERVETSNPSAEMVKLLLDYGAQVYMNYARARAREGQYSEEFLWTIIEYVKEKRDSPPSDSSEDEIEWHQEEYNKIIALLYQGIALQVILLTPTTIMDGLRTLFEEERRKMLKNLIKFHPEAFQNYPRPAQRFQVKKIDPNETVFDVILQGDEEIAEFLDEDSENHIVLRDYDNPDSTFLIDLTNFRNAIDVDKDEEGKTTGGRVVMYQCNEEMESFNITMGRVKNLTPYFDLKGVAGWGGLIPLLEVYDKLLNKPVAERGQYFTYKVLDDVINPLSGIQVVNYLDTHKNRYGNDIDVVSAAHCQEGQYSNLTTIIPAREKHPEDEDRDDDDDNYSETEGGKRRSRGKTRRKSRKPKSRKLKKTVKKKIKRKRSVKKRNFRKAKKN